MEIRAELNYEKRQEVFLLALSQFENVIDHFKADMRQVAMFAVQKRKPLQRHFAFIDMIHFPGRNRFVRQLLEKRGIADVINGFTETFVLNRFHESVACGVYEIKGSEIIPDTDKIIPRETVQNVVVRPVGVRQIQIKAVSAARKIRIFGSAVRRRIA